MILSLSLSLSLSFSLPLSHSPLTLPSLQDELHRLPDDIQRLDARVVHAVGVQDGLDGARLRRFVLPEEEADREDVSWLPWQDGEGTTKALRHNYLLPEVAVAILLCCE